MVAGFRIERLLGEGEMGPVYEATQLSLGRRVALRLLAGQRAARRVRSTTRTSFPVYEAGEWEGGRFVVSRLVRGRTLADLLDAGSLSPRALRRADGRGRRTRSPQRIAPVWCTAAWRLTT